MGKKTKGFPAVPRRLKRDAVNVRLARREAEALLVLLADRVIDADGDLVAEAIGTFYTQGPEELRTLLRLWRKVREAVGRLPYDWTETRGKVPRWSRHR